jgi:hypothetical protein
MTTSARVELTDAGYSIALTDERQLGDHYVTPRRFRCAGTRPWLAR